MNNIILNKIDEIIEVIRNSEEYKKYIEVSNKMEENDEIMILIEDIKLIQKKIIKEESLGKNTNDIDKEINKKLKKLEEYPIYLDYIYLQEDLNNSIQLVKTNIEKYINNITN